MPRLVFTAALLAAMALFSPPAAAQSSAGAEVAAAMDAADRDEWAEARAYAAAAGDPAALTLVQWRMLSAGEGDWRAYRDFVARNGDWPNLARIRAKGEILIPIGATLAEIDAFLGAGGASTGTGALRRAGALAAAGNAAEAAAEVVHAWRTLSLAPHEAEIFRARYADIIRPHHAARADALLWRGLGGEARAMKPFVSPGWAALIDARAELREMGKGVDGLIAAVPADLGDDPGLAWERFQWRMRKGLYDSAAAFLLSKTGSGEQLGKPEIWGQRRALLVRRLYRKGEYIEAYTLASQNHMTDGPHYSDLEWLAGWIALEKLNDAGRAIAHFNRFLASVETPISLGRGYYWLGRAFEAKGDGTAAMRAYEAGAAHQTSFYGQLAAERAGVAPDPALAAGPDGDWRAASFAGRSIVRAAQLLAAAGDRRRTHWFLTHLASTLDGYDELAGAADLAMALGRPDTAVRIGKMAARNGHVLRGVYYPVTDLARLDAGVEPALAMAIGRQESELNPEAVSPAGARGLMQVMPATARKVSEWIGQPYSLARLTSDWRYNATLGQTYLARRLDQYDGSVAMAAAAYNAGASRVDQWIAAYGDPRTGAVDWIDWLETIPFNETRNYVQRVLEGLQVYRSRLAGRPAAFRLKQDALGR